MILGSGGELNSSSGNLNSSSTQVDSNQQKLGNKATSSDRYVHNNFRRDLKTQQSMKNYDRTVMNAEPTDGSTQVDPKSNKRSSDDSKEASGNNSSKDKEEDSKGEDSKEEITKNSKHLVFIWQSRTFLCLFGQLFSILASFHYSLKYDEWYRKSLSLDLKYNRKWR